MDGELYDSAMLTREARRPACSVNLNLFRVQRRMAMRLASAVFLMVFLVAAASAAEIKIKVVDPESAVVAGAQVELYARDSGKVLAAQTTSAAGTVLLH